MTNEQINSINAAFEALLEEVKQAHRLFRIGCPNTAVFNLACVITDATQLAKDIDHTTISLTEVTQISDTQIIA